MLEEELRAALRDAFRSLNGAAEAAIRRELAGGILLTSNDRLHFCVCPDVLGFSQFQTGGLILPDGAIVDAVPQELHDAAEAAGLDVFTNLLEELFPWFAGRWEAAGGKQRYGTAYAHFFGGDDRRYYDLGQRRWCETEEVWPSVGSNGPKCGHEDGSPWLTMWDPIRSRGVFILHRFLGDEVYHLRSATLRAIPTDSGGVTLWFEAAADPDALRRCPDTAAEMAAPKVEVGIDLPDLDANGLVGLTFLKPGTAGDEEDSCKSLLYYFEHEPVRDNRITVISRVADRFMIRWTAETKDVNYYDGSKPPTRIEISGQFQFREIERWSRQAPFGP